MINRFLYCLTARLPCKLITMPNGRPYMERYYVATWWGLTFYLHRFVSGDSERSLHNHPFNAASFVLCGRYTEEIVQDICPHAPGGVIAHHRTVRWFNYIPGNKFHRITEPRPGTWTLFIRGPRLRLQTDGDPEKGWGFLNETDGGVTTVFRTYPFSVGDSWHRTASRGCNVGRESL